MASRTFAFKRLSGAITSWGSANEQKEPSRCPVESQRRWSLWLPDSGPACVHFRFTNRATWLRQSGNKARSFGEKTRRLPALCPAHLLPAETLPQKAQHQHPGSQGEVTKRMVIQRTAPFKVLLPCKPLLCHCALFFAHRISPRIIRPLIPLFLPTFVLLPFSVRCTKQGPPNPATFWIPWPDFEVFCFCKFLMLTVVFFYYFTGHFFNNAMVCFFV